MIESGLSIEEYCSIYGGSIIKIEEIARHLKEENPDIYKHFRKNCCRKPCEEFYLYIRSIVEEMIIRGEKFSIFDYYYLTKLNPIAFKRICNKILILEEF